jgi:structural maintenance of chromosome 4
MNNLKKKMGDNYHNEIDLKNKYEDLEEKIEEYLKEKGRMEEKMKKVENEIKGLRGMVYYVEDGKDVAGGKVEDIGVQEVIKDKEIKGVKNTKAIKAVNKSKSKGKALNKPLDPTPTTPLLNNTLTNNTFNLKDLDLHIKNLSLSLSKYSPKEILPCVFEEFNLLKSSLEKAQNDFNLINTSYKSKRNRIQNLKSKRYEEFMEGFKLISKNLKEIYKSLTYGGNAELELVDYLDPFSEGVVLAVMPPKKCWKNVNNLSGGEKTLSSLSLIFALHKYKPSPFYVMDEIDAALDYRNVSIISNYIKEMTRNSQFIVISLRSDMFEMSKSILGIYKTRNISKFLMIKVDKING